MTATATVSAGTEITRGELLLPPATRHRVVVVGGGFGGLAAVQKLRRVGVDVVLVDRQNYHLFQPLLYQVATGSLSPANIAAPLRSIISRQKNATVLQAEVADFDLAARRVIVNEGYFDFDTLIVAAGATHSYFAHPEWEHLAPGLKSIDDATEMRARVLAAFEEAELEPDPIRRRCLVTFVIVGGGPTGVELAGAICELAHNTLRNDFRRLTPTDAKVVLVDGGPRLLSAYDETLSDRALRDLQRLGTTVMLGHVVEAIEPERVTLRHAGGATKLAGHVVLWAAGVKASPLATKLAAAAGLAVDRAGRVPVTPQLTLTGHDDVFVIGDMAAANDKDGKPLPGIAPVAIQQGKYAARMIAGRIAGRNVEPFRYRDLGSLATIGRSSAVGVIGGVKLKGFIAWMAWLFIHLMQLVSYRNRVLVFLQWMWNYVTFSRLARLITGRGSRGSVPMSEPDVSNVTNKA